VVKSCYSAAFTLKWLCSCTWLVWSIQLTKIKNYLGKNCMCNVQIIQTSSKNFFRLFLHLLIERELLITKIYFLALPNASFRSKNTKYSKGVVFRNTQNFVVSLFFQFLKIIFPDSASKTEYRQIVKATPDPKLYWWWRFESYRVHYV
jgi:hypothetical protein